MTDNEPWKALVAQVIRCRGDRDYAAQRSALARGIRSTGEYQALPYVAGFSSGVDLTALIRSTALIAGNVNAPHRAGRTFGRAMSDLTKVRTGRYPETNIAKRDTIARRVAILYRMDLEASVKEISALLNFAASERVGVDYYDLTRTLLNWGDGLDDASESVRKSIMTDYYTPSYIK